MIMNGRQKILFNIILFGKTINLCSGGLSLHCCHCHLVFLFVPQQHCFMLKLCHGIGGCIMCCAMVLVAALCIVLRHFCCATRCHGIALHAMVLCFDLYSEYHFLVFFFVPMHCASCCSIFFVPLHFALCCRVLLCPMVFYFILAEFHFVPQHWQQCCTLHNNNTHPTLHH